jgi:hypothetical protein
MNLSPDKLKILYHYTSVSTLLKILDVSQDNKISIWATHVRYFNDPYEYNLAISLLRKSLYLYEKEHDIKDPKSARFNAKALASLGNLAGYPFVLALSEKADDLTMWRTYGSDGRGVAIGFDRKMLLDYTHSPEIKNTSLYRCVYSDKVHLKRLIRYWAELYDEIEFDQGKISISSFQFLFDLINFCFTFKRFEYQHEKEWRLCKNQMRPEKIFFLERHGRLIPYVKHSLPREIVKRIIVGPCVNKEMSKESIETFLRVRGYSLEKNAIQISKVPYRQI